jgi:hypothetical protein
VLIAGILALFVVPIVIAAIRVSGRKSPTPGRRIPLSQPIRIEVENPNEFDDQIETYLRGAMKSTGTRLPTAPVRTPRASTPPPPRPAVQPATDFDDDPPTLVSVRPYQRH